LLKEKKKNKKQHKKIQKKKKRVHSFTLSHLQIMPAGKGVSNVNKWGM